MRQRLGATAAVIGLSAALAACSGSGTPAAAPATTASATASPTPSPTPTKRPAPAKPPPPRVNPLTGLPGVPNRPVIAVKIDDTANGRPQIGLEYADVVYVEQVEAGATRLVAVFASRYPARVGPVRSVRRTDPALLSAYGPAGLVFSGGAGGPLRSLHRSRLRDLAGSGVYSRTYDGGRRAPYNLVANLGALSTRAPSVARVRDVGFRWSERDPRLAKARHVMRMSAVVGRTRVSFGFEPSTLRWVRTVGGSRVRTASGAAVRSANVVVQFCRVTVDPGNVDVLGTPSMYTHTVGSGTAVVFRDGRAIPGTWKRPTLGAPTRWYDAKGAEIALRAGGAWVLLAASGTGVRYG